MFSSFLYFLLWPRTRNLGSATISIFIKLPTEIKTSKCANGTLILAREKCSCLFFLLFYFHLSLKSSNISFDFIIKQRGRPNRTIKFRVHASRSRSSFRGGGITIILGHSVSLKLNEVFNTFYSITEINQHWLWFH